LGGNRHCVVGIIIGGDDAMYCGDLATSRPVGWINVTDQPFFEAR
jgi:hypothetical protein